MRFMRNESVRWAAGTAFAAALGLGAGLASGEAKAWSLEEAAAPYAGTSLNIICQAYTPCYAIEGLTPEFTEITGIEVNFELTDLDTAGKKGMTDVITGGGFYDIIEVQGFTNALWTIQELSEPYDAYYNDSALRDPGFSIDDIIPALNDMNCIYQGKQVCMPKEYFVSFAVMRKDIIADAGERAAFSAKYGYDLPPANDVVTVDTWEQWGDMAEFFTRDAGETLAGNTLESDFYGISVSFKRYLTVWYDWMEAMTAMGGEMFDSDYNLTINSPEGVAALDFMRAMTAYAPPSYGEYTWDEQYSDFCNGNTFSGWAWADVAFYLQIEEDCPASAHNTTHFLYPGEHLSIPYANTWTIPSTSTKKEAAYLWVQWTTSYETQMKATKDGWLPNRRDVLADPKWQEDHHTASWTTVHLEALDNGYLGKIHKHPGSQALLDMMVEELSAAIHSDDSSQIILDKIQEQAAEFITKE